MGIELRLETDKNRGYIFRSTKGSDDKKLANAPERVETLSILKNGVHFVTPKLKMASERFMELKHEYTQKQVGTSLNHEESIRSMNQKQIWPPSPRATSSTNDSP